MTETQRTVTPASGRTTKPGTGKAAAEPTTGTRGTTKNAQSRQADQPAAAKDPLYDLTQVHFKKGMRGRYGSRQGNRHGRDPLVGILTATSSPPAPRFANTRSKLNLDRLPVDGMFLTGQTLRVISEPPPPGSPKATPARTYMKAWEKAYASSNDKVLQGDVITYDSYKDLIYAYGENGRNVIFAEQYAAGQPTSPGSSKAVQLNPKTGTIHLINSDTLRMLDKKTGVRPGRDGAMDPNPKKPKKPKKPFKLPTQSQERKGFTRNVTRTAATMLRALVVDDPAQLVDRDIAAAQDQADVLAGELVAPLHGGGDGRRAGSLDDLAGRRQAAGGSRRRSRHR